MDHHTFGRLVGQVGDDAVWSRSSIKHLTVPDHNTFLDIAVKFQERWNFPNVMGCIDGKLIRIKCPGAMFYNYSQFFIVLQGVADSECGFVFTGVGDYGKQSDGVTFSASISCHFLEDPGSTLPKPVTFEGSATEMPFFIRGDGACPLKTYSVKPCVRNDLSDE
jgi:hypothetical protein